MYVFHSPFSLAEQISRYLFSETGHQMMKHAGRNPNSTFAKRVYNMIITRSKALRLWEQEKSCEFLINEMWEIVEIKSK